MERLIDNDLIYGSMLRVREPHLVERYNYALQEFGLPPTTRTDFVVDAAGYSPEIAIELGDEHYLDPHGINRRFIILSPEQRRLPVISSHLSATADLLAAFYRANLKSLTILTLKDVVLGEIEESTLTVDDLSDLLSIRQVEFKLKTSHRLLEKADRLNLLIKRFRNRVNGWKDRKLLNEILELSRLCGDIRHNQILPRRTRFDLRSYWTSHFGGIYVFNERSGGAVVIGRQTPQSDARRIPGLKRFIPLDDHEAVFEFLSDTDRLEEFDPEWLAHSGLVDMRADILARSAMLASEPNVDIREVNDVALKNWIHANVTDMEPNSTFRFLTAIQKKLLNISYIDLHGVDARLKMQIMRANPRHRDQVLVNRLLCEYVPYDFVSRFILDKQAFYDAYQSYSDRQRQFAVDTIKDVYLPNKQKLWERLYEETEV